MSGVANPAHSDRRTCHAIARNEHSCARYGVFMNYPGRSKRAFCPFRHEALRHALTPGHWNLFLCDCAVFPGSKRYAGVPPNAFVLRTTGTRMLVPRNRVARPIRCRDLLDSYGFSLPWTAWIAWRSSLAAAYTSGAAVTAVTTATRRVPRETTS